MQYSIVYNSEIHIIEARIYGDVVLSQVKELIAEYAVNAKEKGCTLILSDYREATIKLSTIEIYEMPKILTETFALSGLSIHHIKRALVVAKELKEYLFFETVTFNRGQYAKIFKDITEAREWLLSK
jgi:hypothetical protein